jgi:uncharacterized protein
MLASPAIADKTLHPVDLWSPLGRSRLMVAMTQGTARTGSVGAGPTFAQLGPRRWHFQHGPIDLILQVEGERPVVQQALADSWQRFQSVLPQLVSELSELRRPVDEQPHLRGPVAARMLQACTPFAAERFITSMAAVAGAVADELIEVFKRRGIARASINNGGDIALHLTSGQHYRVGICAHIGEPSPSPSAGQPASRHRQ